MLTYTNWNYKIFVSEKTDWSFTWENRLPVFQDFVVGKQLHWIDISVVENINQEINLEVDGFISNLIGQKFAVKLADCNWVVVMWKNYFGVVHAGWKWVWGGIVQNAINKLIELWENSEELNVFVWPSIRSCCYKVWDDFDQKFDSKYLKTKEDWLYLDMASNIIDICTDFGIKQTNISILDTCTNCSNQFFSYRSGDIESRFIVWVEKIL